MRLKQYIIEMAMPRELDLKKTYYHGTDYHSIAIKSKLWKHQRGRIEIL